MVERYTMAQYLEALKAHDWLYQYSDDGRTYRAGVEANRLLEAMAAQLDRGMVIYKAHQPEALR